MRNRSVKKTSKLKGIKYVLALSVFLLFSIVVYQNIKVQADEKYIPSILGHTYLNVLSNSMVPQFQKNDLIISKEVNKPSEIEIGDIITFKDGNMLVTHRVVGFDKKTKTWTTKGDANNVEDQKTVKIENIVSEYSFKIPKAGLIIAKLQDFTFLGLLWLIAMYWTLSEIFKEVKRLRKEKRKQESII